MWAKYNPNPEGLHVGDCVVRALCRATGESWERMYTELALQGMMMHDMPSANRVWGAWLKNNGYTRFALPDNCPDCYTVEEFAEEHTDGIYILATGTHVVAIADGYYFDSWDSGEEIPIYYWKKTR